MDEIKMERMMRETLKGCAQELEAPERLKARIDAALKSNDAIVSYTRPKWRKRIAAVCLVAAVAVVGAVAGGGVIGWSSSTRLDKGWTDYAQTAEYVQKNIPNAKHIEEFSNGFAFAKGYENTVEMIDESGNTLGAFTGVILDYEKDGVRLSVDADPVQEDASYAVNDSDYGTWREIDGVKVHYYAMPMITLPSGTEPTAEEQAAFERGEINVAYTGENDPREETTFYGADWIEDGISYSIYSTEDIGDLTEEDFFRMAQEIIAA